MKTPCDNKASEIANALLARTGAAIARGDFHSFASCFDFPHLMITALGRTKVGTRDQLRVCFERVRWHFRSCGADRLERNLRVAVFLDPKTILSMHAASAWKGEERVQAPYDALSTLVLREEGWRISDCSYAISDSIGLNRALYGEGPLTDTRFFEAGETSASALPFRED